MKHGRFFLCLFASLLAVSLAAPAIAAAQTAAQPIVDPKPCTHPQLTGTATVGDYLFKAYKGPDGDTPGCVRVYLHGKFVYRLADGEGLEYDLGQPAQPEYKVPLVANGSDLTGEGHPDMMITSWSGGAHCCFTKYIYELEPKLRLIAKIDDGDLDLGHFEDLDHNQHYFYMTGDIWSYWPQSFLGSVSHDVILRWNGKKFVLDLDRMKAPPPTPEHWQAELKAIDDAVKNHVNSVEMGQVLWNPALDLIYTGHSDLAWKLVREANPKALRGDYPDLGEFCSHLKDSRFWPELKPTLKDVPPACARAKAN